MKITFTEFLKESYLQGNYAPLYHYTNKLELILETDRLKTGTPATYLEDLIPCISFTRNPEYTYDNDVFNGVERLKLDQNKLRQDGYNPTPIDELYQHSVLKRDPEKYSKGKTIYGDRWDTKEPYPYKKFKTQTRIPPGEKQPSKGEIIDPYSLEYEFEERLYENIENIGKYIIAIQFPKDKKTNKDWLNYKPLKEYLEKYPQIELEYYFKKRWKTEKI